MAQPEQQAREKIDRLLAAAGWHVCDFGQENLKRAQGLRQAILTRAFQPSAVPPAPTFA